MSIGHRAKAPGTVTAVLVAAALSFSLTACGGGDGEDDADEKGNAAVSTPADIAESGRPGDDGGSAAPEAPQVLATIKGGNGFQFTVHSAVRDDGGFLTLAGVVQNVSGKRQAPPVQWNGQEKQVKVTGRSLAGITLVDKAGKKRYYVLRDTDGYPLTTTGLSAFEAGRSVDFFAQFPAPPEDTDSVDVQIPLMPSATIEIS
ncbi:hypothetical protein GCM10010387_07800 [Streptomyces inusitatus]|uniref:Secreted protein n=1 Tax=Streptomyces inusitatus TaxID=68221 RepID=A0A918UKA2_9ACTN|nr:hypothetical protein [Streptomyces inusitatus]GGZ17894.1 hypothetical protein GCM10010387_07800 [Streptomyces inusitatus]